VVTYQPDIVRDLEDGAGEDEDVLLGQQLLGEVDVVLDVLKLLDFNSHLYSRERRSRVRRGTERGPGASLPLLQPMLLTGKAVVENIPLHTLLRWA
jgi:hypothetical protein